MEMRTIMQDYTHATGTIIGKDGYEIFFQSWSVKKPEGVLVIAHGLGEHSGRYVNLINALKGKGIDVYALDHRGHGKSAGKRGHVNSFSEYVDDLKIFINIVKNNHPGLPLILLGHSMGGVIAFSYALSHQQDLDALILSSAGLIPTVEPPAMKAKMAMFLSRILPSVAVSNELDAEQISHDRKAIDAYINDPLVHDRITFRWFSEFIAEEQKCMDHAADLKMPLLVFHGTDDRICDFSGSILTHEKASSKDKTIHLFEGLYHETMNEVEHERAKVLETVSAWILKHVKPSKSAKTVSGKKPAPKKSAAPKKKEKAAPKKKAAPKAKAKAKTKKEKK